MSYPYNTLIADLPENKRQCQLMMVSLEKRLNKTNLTDQFNDAVRDFMSRGVIQWVDELPAMQGVRKSYIPLTYSLNKNKLRICGNSSFKGSKNTPSLNEAMISGPAYLNSLEGILYRWRSAFSVAHGDLKHCYHQIKSATQDMSYRRIFIRNNGMGSKSEWREA